MLSSTKFIEEGIMFKTNKRFDFQGIEISLMPVHQSEGYWLYVYENIEPIGVFAEQVSDEFNIYIEGHTVINY